MEKKILFPIVLLQGNSVITARTVIVKFSPDGELFSEYIMIQICKSIFCYIELMLCRVFAKCPYITYSKSD